MRIVQIGAAYIGAQYKIENSIHNYVTAHGDDSYILFALGESTNQRIIKYESRVKNVIRRLFVKAFGKNPHFSILSTIRVISLLKKIDPDVVHLHILHHGYLDYIVLFNYLEKKKKPVVYTMHDMWAFTGGCYYYSSTGCENFKSGCNDCTMPCSLLDCPPQKTNYYFMKKNSLYKKITDLSFVSVSEWVYQEFNKSLLKGYSHKLIWNGLELEEVPDQHNLKCDYRNERFRIVAVALSWGERKGISRFLELSKLLDDRFEIILIGDVDIKYVENADNKIQFVGPIKDKSELYRHYCAADINLSMSSEETFGMTFLEAAIVGTRSIGLNNTAVPQILKLLDGYVVDNVQEVASLLNHLFSNRILCKLDNEKISKIRNTFSSELMAQKYYELYKDMYDRGTL